MRPQLSTRGGSSSSDAAITTLLAQPGALSRAKSEGSKGRSGWSAAPQTLDRTSSGRSNRRPLVLLGPGLNGAAASGGRNGSFLRGTSGQMANPSA